MKNKFIVFGLALALILPAVAGAAIFRGEGSLTFNQAAAENVYLAGGVVRQTASVVGDSWLAGGNLFLTGSTSEDVLAIGGQVDVAGAVGGDLRLAGGHLTLRAPVAGDVAIAGGEVALLPEAVINGDLSVAAGQVALNNRVDGDVVIRAGQITLGEQALITGKLTYYSAEELVVPAGAQILGGLDYHPLAKPLNKGATAAVFGFAAVSWLIFKLLTLFVGAWILIALLGAAAPRLVSSTLQNFWPRLGWGFVILVVTPVLALMLMLTIIGLPLGFGLLALYGLLLVLARIFAVIFLGSWLVKRFSQSGQPEANWKSAALGALVMALLGLIPVLGWIACLILFLAALGAVSSLLLGWWRGSRLHA